MRGVSYKDSGLLNYGGMYLCRICKHKFWNGGKDSIMTAIETYLNYLIAGEEYGLSAAFTERIQCLTKMELVHLLEEELKTRIIEDKESCYIIRKDNLLDDSILSEIERAHAASHPDENPETIARRKRFWSAGSHGYWYHKSNY